MKVLHVLDTSIPDSAGYTIRGNYLVANQKRLGCQPVILTSERFSNANNVQAEEIEGIKYYRSEKSRALIRRIPFLAENNEMQALGRRVAEVADIEKVDIVHAHSPSLIGAACLGYCQKNNIPLVYEIRAFWEDAAVDRGAFVEGSFKYKLRRYHETSIVRKVDAVIAICDGIKNDLLKRGISESKIHVVRNGVDYEAFRPLEPNFDLKGQMNCPDKIIIGFIGSFFNFEGLQDLVKAMKEIAIRNENVVLLLVGEGQNYAMLREMVKKFSLERKILFTGRVPHELVKDYYSIIDVLVYPRIKKRITDLVTPLKPLEAMAMGKTVVLSDVGGLKELINTEGIAEFFRAGDIGDLVNKCLELSDNKTRRNDIGKMARENIKASWGWDKRARQDIEIYSHLVGR